MLCACAYTRARAYAYTCVSTHTFLFVFMTLLTRRTDDQHEVPTTVYHSAFGDDFVPR